VTFEDKINRPILPLLNDDPLVALPVELGVENLLPRAEVELAIGDRHNDLMVDDQRFEVSVAVIFAGLVVLVILPDGASVSSHWSMSLMSPLSFVVDVDSAVMCMAETRIIPSLIPDS